MSNFFNIWIIYLVCKQNWTLPWSLEHLQLYKEAGRRASKQKLFVCTCMHARTPTCVGGSARVGVEEGGRERKKEKYFPWFCSSGPGNRWFTTMDLMLQNSSYADATKMMYVLLFGELLYFFYVPHEHVICFMKCMKKMLNQIKLDLKLNICKKKKV